MRDKQHSVVVNTAPQISGFRTGLHFEINERSVGEPERHIEPHGLTVVVLGFNVVTEKGEIGDGMLKLNEVFNEPQSEFFVIKKQRLEGMIPSGL